jgi:Protein of unknown function (DUF742)
VSHDLPEQPAAPSGALIRPFLAAGDTAVASAVPQDDETGPGGSWLRPFLLTEGRVARETAIAIETQVVTTERGRAAGRELSYERRDIVALCCDPQSVAEIAAQLRLHLGVVRVLVGDLSDEGHVAVYLPNGDAAEDVDTLVRVIRGLRAIG